MSQPCPDGVDVHTRPQQMGGGGMADDVGTHSFFGDRRDGLDHHGRMALNQCVDAEPSQRLATAVEKNMLRWPASIHHLSQHGCCPRPERATALLVALAANEGCFFFNATATTE